MKNKLIKKREVRHRKIVFYVLLFMVSFSYAQVGVGNTDPQATLDITASNQATPSNKDGILIPRIDALPLTPPTAAQDGMLVYLTTAVGLNSKGFYYWDQATTSWIRFSSIEKLNDLSDAKSDVDGSEDGSSIFIGIDAGANDNGADNNNVGVGFNALQSNAVGIHNSAFGYFALTSNTASNNSAFGFSALKNNTTGVGNSAFGKRALEANTTSNQNTAMGADALRKNTGSTNTAIGNGAMFENTSGSDNVAVGNLALTSNQIGKHNTAVGTAALNKSTADSLTAVGYHALFKNVAGTANTAVGYEALNENVNGNRNSAFGHGALRSNTADSLTAVGYRALYNNVSGVGNTAIGNNALNSNVTSSNNTAIGDGALKETTSGNNTAIGTYSGAEMNDGSSTANVIIGQLSGVKLKGSNNVIVGQQAGRDAIGDDNVFIGKLAGKQNIGINASNRGGNIFIGNRAGSSNAYATTHNSLVIDNSNTATPLIYGEFNNDILRINGELQVADPSGTGYAFPTVDGSANQILVTDGSGQLTFEDQQTIPVVPDVSTFPIIRATLSSNQSLSTGGSQKIAFDTVGLNPTISTEFVIADNQFVAAATGVYRIDASFHTTTSQTNTEYYGIEVHINGTLYQEYVVNHYYNGTDSSQVARQISCVANVTAGQTIEIFVNNNQAGVVLDAAATKTQVTIERIR